MKPLVKLSADLHFGCHWRLARQCAKSGRLLFCMTAIGLILGSTLTAHADRKSREEEKARQQRLERQLRDLEYILKHESDGTLSDRKDALKAMLSTGVAPDEAYWQAGYIKKGDQWVSVRDRWLTPEQEQKVDDYAKVRTEFADIDEDHYKLAQWCADNSYDTQAYAHLKAVLLNHPDHAGLRRLLGYQKIGNRWMNAEEFQVAVREADRLVKELQEWGPEVVEIRDGLHSSDPRDQKRAKTKLKGIMEVAAVPALEMILLPSSELAAQECVQQLCRIEHRRSTVALCRAAMSLPESAVNTRRAAIEELKTRPRKDFVPVLLDQLASPMTARYRILTRGSIGTNSNQFLLQVVGVSENRLHHEVSLFNQLLSTKVRNLAIIVGGNQVHVPSWMKVAERREKIGQRLMDHLKINEERLESINLKRQKETELASEILTQVTSIESLQSPEDWWDWWNAQNEIEILNKPGRTVEVNERQNLVFVEFVSILSCFTAGTPVWTDRGPRPIEQLRVGDMALSKDVETGELAYRPIIRTTTRKPKPLVTIDLGAEQITSTGGHPFFVPGEGWVRARELKAGQFLHTPTGTIRIDSVKETPDEETYNLVIDGFHTYFVGMSQALVHDVSITSPTDAVVPGLLDR